jgi:hypothetical protein
MIENRNRFLALDEALAYAGEANHRVFRCHFSLLSQFNLDLERDDFSSNRHPDLSFCLSMIFSENRYPLFRIML